LKKVSPITPYTQQRIKPSALTNQLHLPRSVSVEETEGLRLVGRLAALRRHHTLRWRSECLRLPTSKPVRSVCRVA